MTKPSVKCTIYIVRLCSKGQNLFELQVGYMIYTPPLATVHIQGGTVVAMEMRIKGGDFEGQALRPNNLKIYNIVDHSYRFINLVVLDEFLVYVASVIVYVTNHLRISIRIRLFV